MPIYALNEFIWFPPPSEYEEHGIVAVGGDLSEDRLLEAYKNGIFPWYNPGDPITWWNPPQRMVLRPEEVKVSKSMRNILNRGLFELKADTQFEAVIDNCQKAPRFNQEESGTWLNDELKEKFISLHQRGIAHSVEAYQEGTLVGGLYGLAFGEIFTGDSMFSLVSNASKFAFIQLCRNLSQMGFRWIDCQLHNEHLASLGAYEIPRDTYLQELELNKLKSFKQEHWSKQFQLL